ncbi:MAG: putrescine/spermidine ABC transporter ATP-binding protein [Gammaproteobacteria bacterium RIFCSPHIGHO2_12_FULL_41_15]|nr:MAG: putrescine/spermidine ABC transporter ATP-binding protein [Gammaproteobacteria bacterium RIFCSPHIGHO2_12_FULL_41_15]
MSAPIISLQQISKRFDENVALHNISLDIVNGEFLTILGPSGCGKTTLLRLLSGFDQPDTGSILLKQQDITHLPPERRHLNIVFQNYALFPHMTVFQNVAFGLECQKLDKAIIQTKVRAAVERVKLTHTLDRKPDQLSGGQQQRIAIARALVNEPLVLLLDEPLSALDYHLRKKMQIELKDLQRKLGMTFIMVTHDQEEALSLSDRVVVMDHGNIAQIGTPREIYEKPATLDVAKFIGETNIFHTQIISANEETLQVDICGQLFQLANPKRYKTHDMINIVIRPEDIQVWGDKEVKRTNTMLPGLVKEVIYKGSTVDLIVELSNGQRISATEFFNEDDEELIYEIDEKVLIKWQQGWEVIIRNETI